MSTFRGAQGSAFLFVSNRIIYCVSNIDMKQALDKIQKGDAKQVHGVTHDFGH